jgi:hypothetical protein
MRESRFASAVGQSAAFNDEPRDVRCICNSICNELIHGDDISVMPIEVISRRQDRLSRSIHELIRNQIIFSNRCQEFPSAPTEGSNRVAEPMSR